MKVCNIVNRFGTECVGDSNLDASDTNAAADARQGDLTFVAAACQGTDLYHALRAIVEDRLLAPSSFDRTWDESLAPVLEDQRP